MRRTIGAEEVEALTLSLVASGATTVGLWLVCPSYALFEAFLLGWRRGVKQKQRHELQRHVMHCCVLGSGWIYLRQCLLNGGTESTALHQTFGSIAVAAADYFNVLADRGGRRRAGL